MSLNLHDWPIGRRLLVAFVMFLLPIVLLSTLLVHEALDRIDIAKREQLGAAAVLSLARDQDQFLRGSLTASALADRIARIDTSFDPDFARNPLARALSVLKSGVLKPQEVSETLVDLMDEAMDGSGLILDPELGSFHVMDSVANRLPQVVHALGLLARSVRDQDRAGGQSAETLIIASRVQVDMGRIEKLLATAFRANTDGLTRDNLAEPLRSAVAAVNDLLRASTAVAKGDASAAGRVEPAWVRSMDTLAVLRDRGLAELDRLLAVRVTREWGVMALEAGLVVGLFLLSCGFMLYAIQFGTARPIQQMTAAMARLSQGDLDADIPAAGRRDEVGQMATAMVVFRDNARRAAELQREAERVAAAKDRRQVAMDQHTQDFGAAASGAMGEMTEASTQMRTEASEMLRVVGRTRELAVQTATGAVESARNLTAIAAASEEMSASIDEISRQVQRAATVVRSTVEMASSTDSKVASLADAAEAVGDVVRMIGSIAGQTNLLALNATIEAARAGEAGKGFAVVAGEVKALAAQTAKATEDIVRQISSIRSATQDAVEAVRGVGSAIVEVDQIATAIASAVEQQGMVTRDIVASVQSATIATQDATRAMEDVSGMSGQVEQASRSVMDGADAVSRTAGTLGSEVKHFLTAIARLDDAERRRYERIPGNGVTVAAMVGKEVEGPSPVLNVSRGGIAVRNPRTARPGTEIRFRLPDGAEVLARVVRTEDGVLAAAFRQDEQTLALVDRFIDRVTAAGRAAA